MAQPESLYSTAIEIPDASNVTSPVTHELETTENPFIPYYQVTSLFFYDFFGTPEKMRESITYDHGYIGLQLLEKGKDQTVLSIARHVSMYLDGNIGIQDTKTVHDQSLLSETQIGKHLESNFELDTEGNFVKLPTMGSSPEIQADRSSYFAAIVKGFQKASVVEGSSIWVGNTKKFVSNGEGWVYVGGNKEHPSINKLTLPGSAQKQIGA